jgi:low temperature requirement protein LtrA
MELFFDLVFVVAIDQVARRLSGLPSWPTVLGYAFLATAVWWAWIGYVTYYDRFGTDDLSDRLLTLLQMGAVAVMAVRAHDALEGGTAAFVTAYAAFRLIIAFRYWIAATSIPVVRAVATRKAVGYATAGAIWVISVRFSGSVQYALWALGLLVDIGTPFAVRQFHVEVPPDHEHLEDRFGTFINIVLGEAFVGLVEGMRTITWTAGAAAAGAFALVLAFAIWWIYFESLDTAPILVVRQDKRLSPFKIWVFAHLPLSAGIAAAGIAVGAAVNHAPDATLPDALRWLMVGSIALCFGALAILNIAYAMVGGAQQSYGLALRSSLTAVAVTLVGIFGHQLSSAMTLGLLCAASVVLVVLDIRSRARDRIHLAADVANVSHARGSPVS